MTSTLKDILIFDRDALRQRKARSSATFTDHDFLHHWAQGQINDRLQDIKRKFETVLNLTPYAPALSPTSLPPNFELCKIINSSEHSVSLDREYLPFADGSLDLITSVLNLHSINDLPGMLTQIRRALKPDGLFLAAMFGGETLHELRDSLTQTELQLKGGLSPRVFPFADKQQMGALLQRAGFALPVVDSEILTVTYDNMFALMHELRGMGETNIIRERSRLNPGKALFMEAAKHYAQHHTDPDGRIRASFEIIFLIGWSPHDSQQKPLKPGSAQTRLADILNTEEIKTPI